MSIGLTSWFRNDFPVGKLRRSYGTLVCHVHFAPNLTTQL